MKYIVDFLIHDLLDKNEFPFQESCLKIESEVCLVCAEGCAVAGASVSVER